MFTTVNVPEAGGALAVARSKDMLHWEDLGRDAAVVAGFQAPESPRAFVHEGRMYLFTTSGFGRKLFVTGDPASGEWEEVPFQFPEGGLWSGWEVVQGPEGQLLFSAFLWKMQGNFIRFWEVDWQDGVPVLLE
jgi:hypothetical protein